MPLYEYECGACHRRTEKIQKFSDPELTICPFCGGLLARTLTAPAIQFKGAGWYKDLYSSAKPPASGASATDAAGAGSTGGEAASASKGESASKGGSASKGESAAPAASAPASAPTSGTSNT